MFSYYSAATTTTTTFSVQPCDQTKLKNKTNDQPCLRIQQQQRVQPAWHNNKFVVALLAWLVRVMVCGTQPKNMQQFFSLDSVFHVIYDICVCVLLQWCQSVVFLLLLQLLLVSLFAESFSDNLLFTLTVCPTRLEVVNQIIVYL